MIDQWLMRRPRSSSPVGMLMLILALVVLTLSPLAGPTGAAAQDDGEDLQAQETQEAEQPEELQATEDIPTVTEEAQPTEEAAETEEAQETEEATEEAEETPEGEQLGAIEVEYRECPAGYDIAAADADTVLMECAQVNDVEFRVGMSDGATVSQLTGELGDSHVSFTELPTGMMTITQVDAPGDVVVTCEGIVQHGGPETGVMSLPVSNGSVQWDLQDDEIVFCNWFATSTDAPSADLTVFKYTCPEGYDVQATDANPMADCTELTNGVTFVLTDDDPGTVDLQTDTGDSVNGAVFFGGLPAGDYTLTETLPDGIESAFLWNCATATAPDPASGSPPLSEGESYDFQMTGEDLECHWFNVPESQAEGVDPAGTPTGEQLGAIEIEYRECPDGYDIAAADPDTVLIDCAQVDDVEFQVAKSDGMTASQLTGEFGDSHVSFTELPTGMTTVTQTTPYAETYVTCNGIVQHGGPETGEMAVPVTNGAIEWNLLDDEIVFCNWFSFPGSGLLEAALGTGTVYINKHACPAGYDASAHDMYDMAANCHEDAGVVNFSVFEYGGGGYDGGIKPTSGGPGPNLATFTNVPNVKLTIYEEPVAAYTDAVVFCGVDDGLGNDVTPTAYIPPEGGFNTIPIEAPGEGNVVFCDWYNLPDGGGNTVTIYKWICPEGTVYDQEYTWYETNCTQYSDDFTFTLTTTAGTTSTTPNTGQYQWIDVPMGPIGIQETIPPEYGSPVVYCGASTTETDETPSILATTYERYDAPTGYVSHEIPDPSGYNFYCQWFNIPGGPGEITIYKWTCPEGYDLYAYGADPLNDCKEATNGVTFFLDHPDPADTDQQSDTGDSIEGAVYFGGLKPGTYTATEEVPAETDYVFVLDCTGGVQGKVHPYPLSIGDTLDIEVHAGDKIVCHWFNVPGYDPDYGRMTVYKYACSTPSYVSEVDCEIYEDGATFDLVVWNGSDWVDVDTKTTDGAGKITWINLEPGQYWLDEQDHQWCAISSTQLDADEEYLQVNENQETVVKVYNCQIDSSTKGKQPTKYPNTGVGPSPEGSAPATLPSFAGILGLALLSLTRPWHPSERERPGALRPSPRRPRGRRGDGVLMLPFIALLALVPAIAGSAQDGSDGDEASPGTPQAELCLPGTPEAGEPEEQEQATEEAGEAGDAGEAEATETPVILRAEDVTSHNANAGEDECVRGAVPASVTIEAIAVEAEVEILETVGGVMQAPSGAEDVAWYKETARLGEPGNIVLAGHLNYWGVPEGVFFALGTLRPGDVVAVTGDDGQTYHYAVAWVRQEDATQPPSEEVLGPTGEESLTLITCGGEWDPAITEYDERTVVRAVRVTDAEGTPDA